LSSCYTSSAGGIKVDAQVLASSKGLNGVFYGNAYWHGQTIATCIGYGELCCIVTYHHEVATEVSCIIQTSICPLARQSWEARGRVGGNTADDVGSTTKVLVNSYNRGDTPSSTWIFSNSSENVDDLGS